MCKICRDLIDVSGLLLCYCSGDIQRFGLVGVCFLLPDRVFEITGSGVAVGGDVGAWFSRFLGVHGCQVVYMSPRHRGRSLHTEPKWGRLARLDNEVSILGWRK